MNRRNFIKSGCTACLSFTAFSLLATGCAATKYITGNLGKDGLALTKDDFKIKQKGGTAYTTFIIVRNDSLQFPICVYRFSDNEYSALWMKCAHQGAELNASGDVLQCPAHGSEFKKNGDVQNGPAADPLRTFPVVVADNTLKINLR